MVNKFIIEWGEELEKSGKDFGPISRYIDEQDLLRGGLVADKGMGAIVLVQLDLPRPLYESSGTVMQAADDIVSQLERQYPFIDVDVSGSTAFDQGLFAEFVNFLGVTFPLVVLLVTLAVIWVSGSFWVTMSGLFASGLTLAATGGIFAWLPITLDQTAVVATLLVMILTVVDCIHIGATYIVSIRNSMDKEDALKESIRINLKPVFFTTLTTSVGLITLVFTGSPPFVLFSLIALIGIFIGFIFSFIFMTALGAWFPTPKSDKILPTDALIRSINKLVIAQPLKIVVFFSGFTILSLVGMSKNSIDEDISNYFMPGHSFDDSIEVLRRDFVASNALSIFVKPKQGSVLSPGVYLSIDEFETWLAEQRGHVSTATVNDIVKEIKSLWSDGEVDSGLPRTSEKYSQYLLIYELSLLFGQSSAEIISPDRSETLITVSLEDLTNKELLSLESDLLLWWKNNNSNVEIEVSGRDLIFAHLSEDTVRKSIMRAALAALLITLFMILTFQSFKWGLFSLIPNILPFIFLFGLWGAVYGEINQATCMAFTIVLGIVVDDSIHFIFKFRDSKEKMNVEEAMGKTYQFVGYAITATTIAFVVNGLILYFSSGFVANAILGAVMVNILIAAWVCDLFLMPTLLVLYYRRQEQAVMPSIEEGGDMSDAA